MGLGATRIGEPTRRDRLLLINAFAIVLLTMLDARRKPRDGSIAQVQYSQNPSTLVVSSGLHALRTHPYHAGQQIVPAHFAETYRSAGRSAVFSQSFEMRGLVSGVHYKT
jgi:hypothetical protein